MNDDGEVVHDDDFYPFGLQMPGRSMTAGAETRENYTGHELDEETKLLYAGARYLDPTIGRWLAVDPLADQFPAFSSYNYTLNNPIRLVDPDGRAPCCLIPNTGLESAVTTLWSCPGLVDDLTLEHSTYRSSCPELDLLTPLRSSSRSSNWLAPVVPCGN
ncbi:MAG: RHS repeat-associated core domain-containing protein [Bacteroidota bacterium]